MKKHLLKLLSRALIIMAFLSAREVSAQDDNYYIYSNVYGGAEPWYTTSNSAAMDVVFGAGEWTLEYFETCDPDLIFSANTNFVFLEGSDGFANELEDFLIANLSTIEDWVDNGGRLLLNSAPNEGDGMSFGFGDVYLTYWGGSGNVHAEDASHPIFNTPYTPVGTSWTGSSFSHASVSGAELTPLIVDDFSPTTVAFSEGRYGFDGIVGFGGMTTSNFHYPSLEATNLLQNIIYYLAFYEIPDHDFGVVSVSNPTSGCGLGVETVTATFKNYGLSSEVNIPVSYQLDGGTVISETIAGPIAAGESVTVSFAVAADLTVLGSHTLVVSCDLATDEDPLNNTTTENIENVPTINVFPYVEAFEDGAAGWLAGGASSSWELGEPAGAAIFGAPPATPGSLKSWTTSLTGYYNNDEKSYVESPCFDFSSLVFPYIEMDINWDIQEYSDGAKVQYSTDAGASWSDLGNVGEGENWFNSYTCYGMWPTFYISDYRGWNGYYSGWKHAYLDLSFLGGATDVKIRIVFASDTYWNFNDGFAFDNVKIADLFANDVGVESVYEPNDGPSLGVEPISVVIKNYGTEPQSGFPVSYKMDGGPTTTETFVGTVDPGATAIHYFAATEDLSVDGDYTFDAWTSMATDEDITNDAITEIVSNLEPIGGTNAYYIYSNTTGGEPWYTTTNSAAMDAVFGAGEWTLEYFETLDPAVVFGTGTCFVFLEGSDGHAAELETFLGANMSAIENWVASGGHLFLNAAPNEGDGMSFGFDGTQLFYPYFTNTAEADLPLHPAFAGPFTPTSTSMSGGSYGHARVAGDGWTPILHDLFGPDNIVAAEKSWGAGTVIFGGMTATYFHSPAPDGDNFRRNIISYLGTCTISDYDMGISAHLSPESSCGLTDAESITVDVKNYGFLPQADVPVHYQVDGGTIVNEIVPGTIDAGETVTYTFSTTADLSTPDAYDIAVWTSLPLDTITTNDSIMWTVNNIPTVVSYPYYQDFELGAQGWISGGSGSTWDLGTPAGFVINTPPPATPESQNSWVTNLTGYYNNNEKSYVTSPCMDFTSLVAPYIEFDLNYDIQLYSDGAKMQYSTDGGASWSDLGNVGEGENWYDSYFCYSMWPTFYLTDYRGWQNTATGWNHAYYDMAFLAGQPNVRLRFVFAADSYWNFNDGFAFDNVNIQDPFDNDLGVVAVITPESAVTLTGSEIVSVLVENFGVEPQSGFNVAYRVNGGTVHTEPFVGTIDPVSTAVMTFAATEDFAADGVYEFQAWTELAIDEDNTNDTLNDVVVNLTPVSGTDAFYIYSDVYGGFEPWYATSNSTGMDAVFGDDAWYLEYFETLDPLEVFDENTCFVYLEGSDAQANELEDFLEENGSMVENWVASGGNLLLNSAPNEGDGMDFGFGGISLIYSWYTSAVTAADPAHPVFAGPWTPIATDFTGFSFGHSRVEGGDITPIIVDTYDASKYVLAEKGWGSGSVVVGGMTPPVYHSPTTEAQNLLQNIYEYIKLCAPVDLGVISLVSPESGCGLGVEAITVTVENFGPSGVSSFPIKYQVDGGPIVSEFASVDIEAGATGTYTFTELYDFSTPGTYELCVWTDFGGDSDESNDMICITIESFETPILELGSAITVCDEKVLDAGNVGSTYLWSTGATTQTITVTESGLYSVTVTNPTTGCTVTDEINVTVNYTPVAGFTYSATGLTVSFTNTSTDGATYNWSFGDGGTSTSANPSHTYAVAGAYTVTLTVTNGCGTDFYSIVIEVGVGVDDISLASAVTVQPNPTSDFANVAINLSEVQAIRLELVNGLGQLVWSNATTSTLSATYVIDMTMFAEGVYQLNIIGENTVATKQIVLVK
jgi:PKD repeat protein